MKLFLLLLLGMPGVVSAYTIQGSLTVTGPNLSVGTSTMVVTGGNVGIGTASPSSALVVVGTATASEFIGSLVGNASSSTYASTALGNGIVGPLTVSSATITTNFSAGGVSIFSGNVKIAGPNPYIDITAPPYNAKGDGTTDDTNAFTLALSSQSNNGHPLVIFVPCGNYRVTGPLNTTQDAQGHNQGSALIAPSPSCATIYNVNASTDALQVWGYYNYTMSNLAIISSATTLGASDLDLNGTMRSGFYNLLFGGASYQVKMLSDQVDLFVNPKTCGDITCNVNDYRPVPQIDFYIYGAGSNGNVWIDPVLEQGATEFYNISNGHDNLVEGGTIEGASGECVYQNGGKTNSFKNVDVESCGNGNLFSNMIGPRLDGGYWGSLTVSGSTGAYFSDVGGNITLASSDIDSVLLNTPNNIVGGETLTNNDPSSIVIQNGSITANHFIGAVQISSVAINNVTTTATTYGTCLSGSTFTFVSNGDLAKISFNGTMQSSAGSVDIYADVIFDGGYISPGSSALHADAIGVPSALAGDFNPFHFSYAIKPTTGTHSVCLGIYSSAASTLTVSHYTVGEFKITQY